MSLHRAGTSADLNDFRPYRIPRRIRDSHNSNLDRIRDSSIKLLTYQEHGQDMIGVGGVDVMDADTSEEKFHGDVEGFARGRVGELWPECLDTFGTHEQSQRLSGF